MIDIPLLRSAVRRGRPSNQNRPTAPIEGKGARKLRTRQGQGGKAKENEKEVIVLGDGENVVKVVGSGKAASLEGQEAEAEAARVLAVVGGAVAAAKEEIAEKKMDEYDSGCRSGGDKGLGAEDEGTTAPLPERSPVEPKWTWTMSTSLLRANAGQIWPLVKDFFNIRKWFPGVPTGYGVRGTNGEVGCVRYSAGFQIPAVDGSDVSWSNERLTVVDPIERLISYEIVDCNIGFKSYVSTIKVLPLPGAGEGDGGGCVIEWSVAVDPVPGWRMVDLVEKYESGFQVMAKKMEDDALAAATSEQAPAP